MIQFSSFTQLFLCWLTGMRFTAFSGHPFVNLSKSIVIDSILVQRIEWCPEFDTVALTKTSCVTCADGMSPSGAGSLLCCCSTGVSAERVHGFFTHGSSSASVGSLVGRDALTLATRNSPGFLTCRRELGPHGKKRKKEKKFVNKIAEILWLKWKILRLKWKILRIKSK